MDTPHFDPDAIYQSVLQCGNDYADKKAGYEALSDVTKSVLADITANFLDSGKITKSEAEMRALASGQYKVHLASVSAARKAWLLAQVKYDSIRMLADLRRTEASNRRAEMSLR